MPFTPIPAVDIRDGRCVRLLQGDFNQETIYADDPVEMARRWEAEGAARLHVVDLDGARDGIRTNAGVIARLVAAVDIPVQVGGGIRTLQIAKDLIDSGVGRVVLGTVALEQTQSVGQWVAELSAERVIVAVETRAGKLTGHGWMSESPYSVSGYCEALRQQGVQRVLYTDVDRDGTLQGPDVEGVRALVEEMGFQVIGSGGVGTLEHVRQLAEAGAEAAVIGKALYDGRIRLRDALELAAAC